MSSKRHPDEFNIEAADSVTKKKKPADSASLRPYASSPCYLHELDPLFHGRPHTDDWASIRDWRQQQRKQLRERRQELDGSAKAHTGTAIVQALENEPRLFGQSVAFYWPLDGEVDLRPLMRNMLNRGITVSLPVTVKRNRPLEFWEWDENTRMRRHPVWDIPVPVERNVTSPSVLLIPLLGFDEQGHRLGNGGGYYDRTLAEFDHTRLAVGVGYEFSRMESIYPQDHDMPMDAIVTEQGCYWHGQ